MDKFDIYILGCGSAKITPEHMPSSQILEIHDSIFMVDCGEGTQLSVQRSGAKWPKIEHIFISHAHGDHYFGLMGMLSMFDLQQRTEPLTIHIPYTLYEVIKAELNVFGQIFKFEVNIEVVDTEKRQIIYENDDVTVYSIPLHHNTPCCGYMFVEKPTKLHINLEKAKEYNIPSSKYYDIIRKNDYTTPDGTIIPYTELTLPPDAVRSYAYCSDTAYFEELGGYIKGVQILYHDCTYEAQHKDKALQYFHSTSIDAAMTAKHADAQQLIIGHYSSRYKNYDTMLDEACSIFLNTIPAYEKLIINVPVPKR